MRSQVNRSAFAIVLVLGCVPALMSCGTSNDIATSTSPAQTDEFQRKVLAARSAASERSEKDFERYLRAANEGDVNAQTNLGAIYWGQRGEYDEGVRWWRVAAAAGDCSAQAFLGQAYETGRGVRTNMTLAAHWYELAANQGNTLAMLLLSYLRLDPMNTWKTRDLVEAYKWYEVLARVDPFPDLKNRRRALSDEMSAAQLARAKRLADKWLKAHPGELASACVRGNTQASR